MIELPSDLLARQMSIRELLRMRFKFYERDASWNGKSGPIVLRWKSDVFGEDGDENWFELELGTRYNLKKYGVEFCWFHWNHGGSNQFVHVPCISKIQTVGGFLMMIYGLGYPVIDLRSDSDVEERYQKHASVFGRFPEGK